MGTVCLISSGFPLLVALADRLDENGRRNQPAAIIL